MIQIKLLRSSSLRVKSNSFNVNIKKRSSSCQVVKNASKNLEVNHIQKKNLKNNCIHIAKNQEIVNCKIVCDECKCSIALKMKENRISSSASDKIAKPAEKNRMRRLARPLKKLQAIDE